MPKTISRLYTRNVSPLEKKTLSEQQIESLEQRNAYAVRTPDLESFEILQAKFKKQPIALNNPIKVAGVKKADLDIYNKVRELIKEEQQDKSGKKMKSIPVADFVYEVKTYLEANYKLGFGHEKSHLSYRVGSTFENTTLDTNKQIQHDKISIRFNDTYFNQSSHFSYSPTATICNTS